VNSEVQFAGITSGTLAASDTLLPLSGFCQLSHVFVSRKSYYCVVERLHMGTCADEFVLFP
jgi:hypothetical protein